MKGRRERQKNGSCAGTQLPITYNLSFDMYMITYNLKNVKFRKKYIKEYEETNNFYISSCPCCNGEEFIKWGSYTRNLIYYENNKKYETTIEIKRIKCKDCGRTHSIIPNFLVPHKVHITEYITDVLKHKITSKKSYNVISNKYQVSRQLIKSWLDCFDAHLTRILVTLEEIKCEKAIRKIKKDLYQFIMKYYQENKKIYMMYIERNGKAPILKWAPT